MGLQATVLGAGSWGTALAAQLSRQGHAVTLWDRNRDRCVTLNETRRNPRYLTDVDLPDGLNATSDLAAAVGGAELVVPVVPSHALRAVLKASVASLRTGVHLCCATKGIEEGTLLLMNQVIHEEVSPAVNAKVTILSGPSFARELALGLPTTFAIAGDEPEARFVAGAFHGGAVRAYHTHDVTGVCVGGSVKNVLAIACGISDGLGMGLNARAGLITRGLAEITRLAVALGGEPLTMMGLAGMGDLVLTCTGDLSRNRRVGLALGQGRTLRSILTELGEVAEGVVTARSAYELGRKLGVDLPITEQVYQIVHEGKPAMDGFADLMDRGRKHELR